MSAIDSVAGRVLGDAEHFGDLSRRPFDAGGWKYLKG